MASSHTTACSIRLALMGGRFAFRVTPKPLQPRAADNGGMDAGEVARLYYLEGVSAETPLSVSN